MIESGTGTPFRDPPNTACISCVHVVREGREILFASHDADDGTWQFLCGATAHREEEASVVGLGTIESLDPGIRQIADLPPGVRAERETRDHEWKFFRL